MSQVFLGLGSNLGHRQNNINKALEHLAKNPAIRLKQISSIYETEPVGTAEQPLFLNACCEIETDLPPKKLLKFLLEVETLLGRIREVPLAPREIDLDILFYDDQIISTDNLVVPHPLLAERSFVLAPLEEIAPAFMHPVFKVSVATLLSLVKDREKVWKFDDDQKNLQ